MSERVSWADPRVVVAGIGVVLAFFMAALGIIVMLAGAAIGIYVVSQKNDATTEVSGAFLSQQMAVMSSKLDGVISAVKTTSDQGLETKKDTEAIRREADNNKREYDIKIENLAEDVKTNTSATNGLRDRVARIEGSK